MDHDSAGLNIFCLHVAQNLTNEDGFVGQFVELMLIILTPQPIPKPLDQKFALSETLRKKDRTKNQRKSKHRKSTTRKGSGLALNLGPGRAQQFTPEPQ